MAETLVVHGALSVVVPHCVGQVGMYRLHKLPRISRQVLLSAGSSGMTDMMYAIPSGKSAIGRNANPSSMLQKRV